MRSRDVARMVSFSMFALFSAGFFGCGSKEPQKAGENKPVAKNFTPEEFKQVKRDMTEEQVKQILGEPFDSAEALGTRRLWWKVGDHYYSASFTDGKVAEPMGPSGADDYVLMKGLMDETSKRSGGGQGQIVIKPRYTQQVDLGKVEKDALKRHFGSVAISADGKKFIGLASSHGDSKNVQIWDIEKKQLLYAFVEDIFDPVPVAFSRDGKIAAYCNSRSDPNVVLVDMADGKVLRKLAPKEGRLSINWMHRLVFSPQGDTIALSSEQGITGWDPKTGAQKFAFKEPEKVTAMSPFFEDGNRLAVGFGNGKINIWDLSAGKVVQTLTGGSEHGTHFIAVSKNGKTLATCPSQGDVETWDLAAGKCQKKIGGQSSWINIEFLPDNKTVVFAGFPYEWKFMINLVNVDTGKVTHRLEGPTPGIGALLSVTPDGQTLASAADDGTFSIWDLR